MTLSAEGTKNKQTQKEFFWSKASGFRTEEKQNVACKIEVININYILKVQK